MWRAIEFFMEKLFVPIALLWLIWYSVAMIAAGQP